ncbi:MAG: hypothetical protein U9N07_07150 [Euryarchaeota archaeon]|nr:hypothetical protein [Euryarchaeota archaeon]
MKNATILAVIAISTALIIGAGCIADTEKKIQSYRIIWAGTPPAGHEMIETELSHQIAPHPGMVYDNVTVSVVEKEGAMRLRVSATSSACGYLDRYEFIYDDHLARTGYLLKAIPESTRQDAIGIAMQDPGIAGALSGNTGTPTVRRILPETTEKFYAAKTCLSVTWADASMSALVDMDTHRVVQTWSGE